MKSEQSSKTRKAGFTLLELCVVIGCLAVVSMLVMPALAAGKLQSASTGCLYNLRHLQTGCAMYSTENNDYLMPNAPLGYVAANSWCGGEAEDWDISSANTNAAVYTNALLWPYVGNNIGVYRCPGDTVPSANGFRLRSYSMNGQMGAVYDTGLSTEVNPGYLTYVKGSDIIAPTPANAFVFCDESPDSIDDGYLQMACSLSAANTWGYFPNIPACYLEGGCGFSFADGHGEIHRWQTSSLLIPVIQGFTEQEIGAVGGARNVDWIWLSQHASSPQ